MFPLFRFTIRQMLLQRRIWLTLLLLAGPCAVALLIRFVAPAEDKYEKFQHLWQSFHGPAVFAMFMVVMPLVCMLAGTTLIGTEVESGTLVYLITRRMRRATVLLVRFAAAAVAMAIMIDLALAAIYCCATLGMDVPAMAKAAAEGPWDPTADLLAYLLVAPLAVVAFLAVFTLISLLAAKPLAISIVYLTVVELVLSNIPLGVRAYSLSHHIRKTLFDAAPMAARMYDQGTETMATFYPPGSTGTVTVCAVTAAALGLACFLMTVRELVPAKVARE